MRWWLSFVDPSRPEGSRGLGACIVSAADEVAAIRVSHVLGINPGGEVMWMDINEEAAGRLSFPLPMDRLITGQELTDLADRIASEVSS